MTTSEYEGIDESCESAVVQQDAPARWEQEDDPPRYGGYDLRRGDSDAARRYAGTVRPAGSVALHLVADLQRDLAALGFLIVGPANGEYDRRVEWAVREFQIYAKMATVARELPPPAAGAAPLPTRYLARLRSVPNNCRYTGPVSGVLNVDTRSLIVYWLTNRWRCPVVMEAWAVDRNGRLTATSPAAENFWLHDEITNTGWRVYVRDFTGYYTFPVGQDPNAMIVLGDFATYSHWSGPRSTAPAHTWPQAELLPESLVGAPAARLRPEQLSSFKVVRASSEVECMGFFDSINAYDNAFVSLGPCHWTLAIVNASGAVSPGELCGYLAYLRYADPAAFTQACEYFGLSIDGDWVDHGTPNGRAFYSSGSRKYAGWPALQLQNGRFNRVPANENELNYFKTWHWFYRFAMAGRTIDAFRQRMWDMARVRLRDILSTPWGAGVADIPTGRAQTRPATIGDVFTSERAVAMLLRWHIRGPGFVVSGGRAANHLRQALASAGISATTPPTDPTVWNDAAETALINGILHEVRGKSYEGSIRTVHDWPVWTARRNPRHYTLDPALGPLNASRGSFTLDSSGLPPAP